MIKVGEGSSLEIQAHQGDQDAGGRGRGGGVALEIQAHLVDQGGEREGVENGLVWRGSRGENVSVRQRYKK